MPQDTKNKVVNALIELAEQNPEKSYFTFLKSLSKLDYLDKQFIKTL